MRHQSQNFNISGMSDPLFNMSSPIMLALPKSNFSGSEKTTMDPSAATRQLPSDGTPITNVNRASRFQLPHPEAPNPD
jgi:hypothetical protein